MLLDHPLMAFYHLLYAYYHNKIKMYSLKVLI
nr:MAG TPA: hypothetical protein [Caudoviricetes sp.]DAZ53583.1 MAG TPA: hypothetical protein [Caudoviricetes sp.]